MADRRNFTMDQQTSDLLEDHPHDNHSQLVRELLQAYYKDGVYDAEAAAHTVRRQRLERQRDTLEEEIGRLSEELEHLDSLETDREPVAVQEVAASIEMRSELATVENTAIQRKAEQHGVDAQELANVVRENARRREAENLQSVSTD